MLRRCGSNEVELDGGEGMETDEFVKRDRANVWQAFLSAAIASAVAGCIVDVSNGVGRGVAYPVPQG